MGPGTREIQVRTSGLIVAVWTEWWLGVSHVARVYLNLWLGSIYEMLDLDWMELGLSVFKSKDV